MRTLLNRAFPLLVVAAVPVVGIVGIIRSAPPGADPVDYLFNTDLQMALAFVVVIAVGAALYARGALDAPSSPRLTIDSDRRPIVPPTTWRPWAAALLARFGLRDRTVPLWLLIFLFAIAGTLAAFPFRGDTRATLAALAVFVASCILLFVATRTKAR